MGKLSSVSLIFFAFVSLSESSAVPGMYVFGDSLVDVGNNNYISSSPAKANFPHNGIDFPTRKPTGRWCNGKNVVDLLAEKIGLPYPQPYLSTLNKTHLHHFLKGVNFGSGGSGILNDTYSNLFILPLTKQVDFFEEVRKGLNKELGFDGASRYLSKSLFFFETGSNDIFAYFTSVDLRKKIPSDQYLNSMAKAFHEHLKRLHKLGARKFAIVGVGILGCVPAVRIVTEAEKCNEELNEWALQFNEALKSTLRSFALESNDIKYSYFEGYTVVQNVLHDPMAYGLSDVKAACCGEGRLKAEKPCLPSSTYCSNRSSYFFWDSGHPTEAAHRIFANYIFAGSSRYTFPLNVKKLITV